MKTAIVYYSKHHGNTKKLLDGIAAENEVTLIDVSRDPSPDLSGYDRVGFASGIYYGGFAKQLAACARKFLPEGREVFYVYTHGAAGGNFLGAMRAAACEKNCREIGEYRCRGFDTFGPFKLVGGVAKGHPTGEEIRAAAKFYRDLEK